MTRRAVVMWAAFLIATCAANASLAQPFAPEPTDERRMMGDWLVEHKAESDGDRIVRQVRVHRDYILEYYVSFWRGNAGPYRHASVERSGRGCGSESWHRDPTGDLWGPQPDDLAQAKIVRALFAEALAECGAGEKEIALALSGFETAFELVSVWAEIGRLATQAEMRAIENYGSEPEPATNPPGQRD